MQLRYIPKQISNSFQVIKLMFRSRHQLVLIWMIIAQIVCQEKATVKALSRHTPNHIGEWHFRRLLSASYWFSKALLSWFAQAAITALPAPEDGICFLIGDSTLKSKRGKKNPYSYKRKMSTYGNYVFGIHIVFLMMHWGNYRIPIDFEIVKPKTDPDHQSENELFRQMLSSFKAPCWAKTVIVLADAAYASKENLKLLERKKFFYVMSLARTWKFENGKSLKDFSKHLKKNLYRKTYVSFGNHKKRQVFWTYTRRVSLRHVGEVTICLSKTRRNHGPKKIKILVTNLPQASSRLMIGIYKKRWWIEVMIKELKGALGLGQHQVTKKSARVKNSIAISVLSYLTLIRFYAKYIPQQGAWSAFGLKHRAIVDIVKDHAEQSAVCNFKKSLKQRASA